MSGAKTPGTGVHATAAVIGECGVLILGPSGSGKSALALALMARAGQAGLFAALVGDDRVWLRASGGRLLAAGAPHMAGQIERRMSGLITVDWEPCTIIRLAVELSPPEAPWPRLPEGSGVLVLEGVETLRLALDRRQNTDGQAEAVLERITTMSKEAFAGNRISLEQCAALHKNGRLALAGGPFDAEAVD